jgi:hypothetical protein
MMRSMLVKQILRHNRMWKSTGTALKEIFTQLPLASTKRGLTPFLRVWSISTIPKRVKMVGILRTFL